MAIYMNYNALAPAGNVTAQGFENWIEVDSFNFGIGRAITMEAGAMSNREATRPSLSEVTITKLLDASSGGLFKQSVTGDLGVTVEFQVVQTGATAVETFAKFTLTECIISSYNISAAAGSAPQETISLSFAKIEADLRHADKTNTNTDMGIVGYDLTTATSIG